MDLRNNNQISRHRRDNRYRSYHRNRLYCYLIVGVLSVIFCTPSLAEETSVEARPQAAATSNNTNQSVQINQRGSSSRQSFGNGVSCNGPTLNITPFYLGNDTITDPYVRSNNWGMQIGLVMPIDGSITEMCKDLVRRQLERERLSYELTRANQCAKLLELGYTIRPDSDLFVICGHVVSISSWRHFQEDSSQVILQDSAKP